MQDKITFFLFFLGTIILSFMAGAVLVYYEYFPYQLIYKIQLGGVAWYETSLKSKTPELPGVSKQDKTANSDNVASSVLLNDWKQNTHLPGAVSDDYTLVCPSTHPSAYLIDGKGKVVHTWSLQPTQTKLLNGHDLGDAYLYPNGDLLAIYAGVKDYGGLGIAKVSQNSDTIWNSPDRYHHSVAVGDNGNIYALIDPINNQNPAGAEFINAPFLDDHVIILTPEGKEIKRISIIEAFVHSPFADYLKIIHAKDYKGDLLHTNKVEPLPTRLADKFPQFKPGDILISMRNISTLAVIDPDTQSVVWAMRGIWKGQHDAQFMDNGHILLFDNYGRRDKKVSRILEIDAVSGKTLKEYGPEQGLHFLSASHGKQELLPNGDLLIASADEGRLIQWNKQHGVVWDIESPYFSAIYCMQRYNKKDLPFMKEGSP